MQKNIRRIEKIFGIQYGPSQEQAIAEAIRSPLFILTGGPGTGKTTVINGIVNLFAELNGLELILQNIPKKFFLFYLQHQLAEQLNE